VRKKPPVGGRGTRRANHVPGHRHVHFSCSWRFANQCRKEAKPNRTLLACDRYDSDPRRVFRPVRTRVWLAGERQDGSLSQNLTCISPISRREWGYLLSLSCKLVAKPVRAQRRFVHALRFSYTVSHRSRAPPLGLWRVCRSRNLVFMPHGGQIQTVSSLKAILGGLWADESISPMQIDLGCRLSPQLAGGCSE
jgi:hypothetical protein